MKKATEKQILAVANKFKNISYTPTTYILYGIDENENKIKFAVTVYRDSLHILAKKGLLKHNEDHTYSAT
jgi:hypothetical protein